jgi:CheY-like chemotaxis protein
MESFLAAHGAGLPFDLILMDVRMSGIDGLEATLRIRAIEARSGSGHTPIVALTANALPGAGRVPVIALTANAFAEDRAACSEAGMDAFVVKPFDRDQLDEAISKARGINALRAANAA